MVRGKSGRTQTPSMSTVISSVPGKQRMRPAPRRRGGELDGREPREEEYRSHLLGFPAPNPKVATVSAQVLARELRVTALRGGPAAAQAVSDAVGLSPAQEVETRASVSKKGES